MFVGDMTNNKDEDFIKGLLKKCGEISLIRRSKFNTFTKGNIKELVTDVDIKIGKYIYKQISAKYPNDSIDCEDGPVKKNGTNSIIWFIDPLDGTTNYVHRLPFFAISISRYDQKKSIFLSSGIYVPFFDQLFMAYGKKIAKLNGQRIKVSKNKDLKRSLILTGMSLNVKKIKKEPKKFIRISSISAGTRRTGSTALDLCYVAAGFADAYYHFNLKQWDFAAGCHLVINAGGKITNINSANSFDFADGAILASNGLIHQKLCEELAK
jgi:myo-inositol-1(or 4)-monophosphatase